MGAGARVAVIGAGGQLGFDLAEEVRQSGFECLTPSHPELDICDHELTKSALRSLKPSVIINLAAFHKVEACEDDPEHSFAVNCHAVRNLAETADDLGALFVHISTDYVFGGDDSRSYDEHSPPNPLNVYGVSKLAGEFFVRSRCRRYLLIRTSGLFGLRGSSGKGGNFVETMIRRSETGAVSVVNDQVLSPTNTQDLSKMLVRLIGAGGTGLFHVTNSGSCSWYEFALRIFALLDRTVEVTPISSAASESAVRRPRFSVLENRRLKDEGFGLLRPWEEALNNYMQRRAGALVATAQAGPGR
jgi:dTDP-4-dehydrorhamnose reductase